MNHWYLCFVDVWSAGKWFLPPLVGLVGRSLFFGSEKSNQLYDTRDIGFVLMVLGYVGYVAAIKGWWV